MSRWNLAWLLGTTALAIVGLSMSFSAPPQEDNAKYQRMRLLVDVLDEVDKNFVRKLSDKEMRKLVEDMINGGLGRLDPYSQFINQKNRPDFDQRSTGKFGGIGIEIEADRQNGVLTVISPIVDTPAYKAGVQAGDKILAIDGQSTETMTREEAVAKIKGEIGKPIALTIIREGSDKTVEVKMVRAEIKIETLRGDHRRKNDSWDFMFDEQRKIGYIRLLNFDEKSPIELRNAVQALKSQHVRGLVLDLRNNPGGLLTSAVQISTLFLKQGSTVVSIRGRTQKEKVHKSDRYEVDVVDDKGERKVEVIEPLLDSAAECPMVVLVNRNSASASEIVAAALQDHKRAVVIGERSYGKGSVQNVIPLERKTSILKLTTASYWRPSGKNIHRLGKKDDDEWGVSPNNPRPELGVMLAACQPTGFPGAPLSPGLFLLTQKKLLSPFEVWLSIRDRVLYQAYRFRKDIVRVKGKNGSARTPEAEPTEEEKAFRDSYMDIAIAYLHGEIDKHAPAVARSNG
jgi:carboxyl-terminal processing protease